MHVSAAITEGSLGAALPPWSVLPFAALLLAIAVLPLTAHRWWQEHRHQALVCALLAVPFAAGLVIFRPGEGGHALLETVLDYVSFVTFLASLYVISGGIHVKGSLAGSPLSNTSLLAIGAVLANAIGTTGASMVLIRPLLRANESRQRKAHIVVFFIFVVSNCGGLLTPLGDPPLFLGFLRGVPFEWTLSLWKPWLLVNGMLLLVFHVVDGWVLDREELARPGAQLERVLLHEPLTIGGGKSIACLAGVILVILGKAKGFGSAHGHWPFGVQEGLMLALTAASWKLTPAAIRTANRFTFGPIVEVAVLFAGIFVTMIAPLHILGARGGELGVTHPMQYFWATGFLSSFLDNAPTYLTFAATACGQHGIEVSGPRYLGELLATPDGAGVLAAISCGAVFMGANTYIGNGPNFMVRSIAESSGVRMPSFFGYMAWSGAVLLPIFAAVALFFFR